MAQNFMKYLTSYPKVFLKGNIRKLMDLPYIPVNQTWDASSAFDKDLFHKTILDSLGGSQKSALTMVETESHMVIDNIAKVVLDMLPDVHYEQNDQRRDGVLQYKAASTDTLNSHLYHSVTRLELVNANEVVKEDGRYAVHDISTFFDWKGVLNMDDPVHAQFIKDYNDPMGTRQKRQELLKKIEPIAQETFRKYQEQNIAFSDSTYFLMGSNLIEHKAAKWINGVTKGGKPCKMYMMLLAPGGTHAFAGFIVHAFAVVGPNTIVSFVIGGGISNMFGIDMVNSYLAPKMWAITKAVAAAHESFNQRKLKGEIPQNIVWKDYLEQNYVRLVQAWTFMKVIVGCGSELGITANKITGQYVGQAPSKDEYVALREVERNAKGAYDLYLTFSYAPWGELVFAGQEEKVRFENLKDGFQYDGLRADIALSVFLTGSAFLYDLYESHSGHQETEKSLSKFAEDPTTAAYVDKQLQNRINDVLDPVSKMLESNKKIVQKYLDEHPDTRSQEASETHEKIFTQAGVPESNSKYLNEVYDMASAQLISEVHQSLETSKPDAYTVQNVADYLHYSFQSNIHQHYTHYDGNYLRPMLGQKLAEYMTQITVEEMGQLQQEKALLEQKGAEIEQKHQQAEIDYHAGVTAMTESRLKALETERTKHLEEIKAQEAKIKETEHKFSEYKKKKEHAGKEIDHFSSMRHIK
ncbi:hypothetical protein K450DRAFT_263068 [Umbelopsis ramanniana AG]|uniref:Uncharacterized protein n=1 Tax=Umbelopsis ramanniana AG TaxID=1314678 RepID=A0AAD5E0F3_UMBRA|nr:uncharacterized protein K450DRAFT_263068 [Umbelopsis ramanniana AG]KAI8575153.1 hypothetical protein K450DRAFT_263068 [Umbelopsis ramanniana AG]